MRYLYYLGYTPKIRAAAQMGKRSFFEGGGATLLHLCLIFWLFVTTFLMTMTTFGRHHDNFLGISWQGRGWSPVLLSRHGLQMSRKMYT
jgi:hypothetical protein